MKLKLYLISARWFIVSLLLSNTCTTAMASQTDDSLALVALHEALTFSWNLSQPMTTWQGVTLDANGRVSELWATPTGGILPAAIGDLTELTSLEMSEADLAGRIPESITNLTKLTYLNLNENDLEGPIPRNIGLLSQLEYLDLSDNKLEGEIPGSIWQLGNLTYLSIGENSTLTGTISPEIANLTKLEWLTITDTKLTGGIPVEIGQLSALKYLYLEENQLTGSIPPEMGDLTSLERLTLGQNDLSGNIPEEIASLDKLQALYLNGNQLSGSVPDFSNMINLQTFAINDNHFTFAGLEENLNILYFYYAPQKLISLITDSGQLSVETGNTGTFGANAYEWYKDGVLQTVTTGNNTFQPNQTGYYHCEIRNTPITKAGVFGKDLVLKTGKLFFNKFEGQVFPGDLNRDGVASNVDVLYWGLTYGDTGPQRPQANTLWEPQPAPDWNTEVAGVNGKHQDGDGNGAVGEDDLMTILSNYGENYPFEEKIHQSIPAELSIRFADLETYTDSIVIMLDIHLEGAEATPATAHGVAFSMTYYDVVGDHIEHSYTQPDATNSWIDASGNNLRMIHKNTGDVNTTDVALTRDDGQNASGMGKITTVRMVFGKDATMPLVDELTVGVEDITLLNATGDEYVINNNQLTIFGLQNIEQGTGLAFAVNTYDTSCDKMGFAEAVIIQDSAPPYQYEWSNGATTSIISELESDTYQLTLTDANAVTTQGQIAIGGDGPITIIPTITHTVNGFDNGVVDLAVVGGDGNYVVQWSDGQSGVNASNLGVGEYTVEISDGAGCSEMFELFIGQEAVPTQVQVFLQGAYDDATGLMGDGLRDKGLIPIIDPYISTYEVDPAVFDVTGNNAIVDWLLLELRDDANPTILQKQQAALLQRDGDIVDLDGVSQPRFEGIRHGLYHLVIRHRNHMPIMSVNPFLLTQGGLIYNFTYQDSYTGVAGFGQYPVNGGAWAMYSGDADQNHEITGVDKSVWAPLNGTFLNYTPADYNLDGDINGSDKGIWYNNNGISSRVPQGEEE